MRKQNLLRPYQWAIIAIGIFVTAISISRIQQSNLDFYFAILLLATVFISSKVSIKIPRYDTNITISDSFIFLSILLYGIEGATIFAAVEGLSSGKRASKQKKAVTILFSAAVNACTTFASATSAKLFADKFLIISEHTTTAFIASLCVIAIIQFFVSSSLVGIGLALKINKPLLQTWLKNCAWSSLSFFVGAASAGLMVKFFNSAGIIVLLIALPVIYILYLTYNSYLNDIKETSAKAEKAERERAEAERARAEQAERHIEEQSHHIAELERISRELEESREHFRHAAFHDVLTGLPNRAFLTDRLRATIDKTNKQSTQPFALLFLDLDRFKYINDSLGHASGDKLLIEISRRLKRSLRDMDMVARLGGDEFAILLDELFEEDEALQIAKRVQDELSKPFYLMGHEVFTAASIGITFSTAGYEHPENVLRDADTAMYRAKEKGKARYEIFDSQMHADAMSRLQLENDLRRAIERNELQVYYQPIISLSTERISGFEALIRWEHPERGFVFPAEFIPLAEETGLINGIGEFILLEACRQIREWHSEQSPFKPFISVNLSGKQFAQPNLIERIKNTLLETGLEPQYLKLEITESVIMENASEAETFLKKLRKLGIKLSIDDFGTGYSSLSYLHRFPFNTLKVDRSFVSNMSEGDENTEIVKTIITLANNLGLSVIAEGVETKEQLDKLRSLKCTYAQGYYFSRPLAAKGAFEMLSKNHALPPVYEENQTYEISQEENVGFVSQSLM